MRRKKSGARRNAIAASCKQKSAPPALDALGLVRIQSSRSPRTEESRLNMASNLARPIARVLGAALLAVLSTGIAAAQCGAWVAIDQVGPISDWTVATVLDPATGELVRGSNDSPNPFVHRRTGAAWTDITPSEILWTDRFLHGLAVLDDGTGPAIHAFGGGASSGAYLLRLVGSSWVPAAPVAGSAVHSAAVLDDGSGPKYFVLRGDGLVQRFDGASWTTIGVLAGGSSCSYARATLVAHDDGGGRALYLACGSQTIDGQAIGGVARWNGSVWSGLGAVTADPSGAVCVRLRPLETPSGSRLYAFGRFAAIGGVVANDIARWNGVAWEGVGSPALTDFVRNVVTFDPGDGGGTRLFAKVSGTGSQIQRLDSQGWTPVAPPSGNVALNGDDLEVGVRAGGPGVAELFSGGIVATISGGSLELALAACGSTGAIGCVGDGSAAPCPCGNESAASDRAGCLNSLGLAGSLRASGAASLSSDTLVLSGARMPNASALYFQGMTLRSPTPFGDGLRCIGGPFLRLSTRFNSGGASSFPAPGDLAVSIRGDVDSPGTRHYGVRYRNAAAYCTPDGFNYTNSVTIVWQP